MTSNFKYPEELEAECQGEWHTGETRRIRHLTREDGSDCSSKKNAALSILRRSDGWWFRCFRCGFKGFKPDGILSAEQAQKALEKMNKVPEYESVPDVTLPLDWIKMRDTPVVRAGIPKPAYRWFSKYGIPGSTYQRFNVGWSQAYQRVIVPIYEYALHGKDLARKLIGWIGRDVNEFTKAERVKNKVAKYITKKDAKYDRIYFHAPYNSDTYVIVEDVLSAMKINNICKVNVFALLTTHIPLRMLLSLKGKKVVIWLDGDQLANMIQTVAKGSQIGLDINYVHTSRDPKCYNDFALCHNINGLTNGS